MGYSSMDHDECWAFLREPVRPGTLATTRKDGRPHVVPIWYDLDDDGTIVFNTAAESVKGRNIRRDGRASLCVQDDQPPFSFVTASGQASWSDDLPDVRRWSARIGGRYMGADRAEEFGARNGVPGELVVRLSPRHLVGHRDLAN